MVDEASGDRVQILDLETRRVRRVYVHAKRCVVDDVWALVGSTNLNVRSFACLRAGGASALPYQRLTNTQRSSTCSRAPC